MLSDRDQEQLETYLDGGLTPSETTQMAHRLAEDPALANMMESVRGQRALRAAVFQSMERDERAADRFAHAVVLSARRHDLLDRLVDAGRRAAVAAACLLIGIGSGWCLWGRAATSPTPGFERVATTHAPLTTAASDSNSPAGDLPAGTYQVALTDEKGNVLAVQKFNRLEEAQQFAQDLGRVEERQKDVHDGKVTLVSDHF